MRIDFSFALGGLVVWEIDVTKFFNLEIFLTRVVFPAPDGEDKTTIVPSFDEDMMIILLVRFTFYKFNSISNS